MSIDSLLSSLHVQIASYQGKDMQVHSPIDGAPLAQLACMATASIDRMIHESQEAFTKWQVIPAPKRGQLVRILGEVLRTHKAPLAELITRECGKIRSEALGEVQEMIDICEFAVGLSRQLYGLTIASERSQHTMQESWYPLGAIGIITAFNFPAAVWAWNAALALVCGNTLLWKPSEKTPLTAIACQALFHKACMRFKEEQGSDLPEHLSHIVIGGREVGEQIVRDARLPLISATGSSRMGLAVGKVVAERFGRSLLELGGNNAIIVTEHAEKELAAKAILFGAAGTAGQRCTSTRRVFVHRACYESFWQMLAEMWIQLPGYIGDPLSSPTLIGPLIDKEAFEHMQRAIKLARKDATALVGGERLLEKEYPEAYYVTPALVAMPHQAPIVQEETFAPILYVMPYASLEEAVRLNNAVSQGLSSAIFTNDLREAEYFRRFSDCGITNINIGTSGAEIGGAFGGEKATGGGRESGSDAWKQYMRRQTSTTYYGTAVPELAQGVQFHLTSKGKAQ